MKPVVVKRPQVLIDLAEHYAFIAQDKIEPADRFLEIAESAFQRLAERPAIGVRWRSRRAELAGILVCPLPSPYRSYLVFYRTTTEGIDVLTVLHGARNLRSALNKLLRSGGL